VVMHWWLSVTVTQLTPPQINNNIISNLIYNILQYHSGPIEEP